MKATITVESNDNSTHCTIDLTLPFARSSAAIPLGPNPPTDELPPVKDANDIAGRLRNLCKSFPNAKIVIRKTQRNGNGPILGQINDVYGDATTISVSVSVADERTGDGSEVVQCPFCPAETCESVASFWGWIPSYCVGRGKDFIERFHSVCPTCTKRWFDYERGDQLYYLKER